MPEDVVFHEDLVPPGAQKASPGPATVSQEGDLSLTSAITRHVHRVYEQSGRSQRQTARLLGISRGKLARHLGNLQS